MRIVPGVRKADRARLWEIAKKCYFGDDLISTECFESTLDVSDVWVAHWEYGDWSPYPMLANDSSIIGFIAIEEKLGPYIWNVAVDPAFQARGIGGNLLRQACQWLMAHDRNSISLHVNTKNPAQKLYFDYGFRVTAVVENLYGGEDGLIMKRNFNYE